jgi:hypothetical protein
MIYTTASALLNHAHLLNTFIAMATAVLYCYATSL